MNFTKSILRRVLGGLFALALVAVSFPMAAFALEVGVGLQVRNYLVDENGDFIERLKTLNNLKYDHEQSFTDWKLDNNTIDLWVYSSEMEGNGQTDGSVVPYTYDDLGNKYELTQIVLTSQLNADQASDEQKIVLMDSSAIRAATSRDSYRISTESLTLTPGTSFQQPVYYVAFCWTKTEETKFQKYQVSYDLNLPTDIPDGSMSLYPVMKAGMLPGDTDGSLGMIEDYVTKLAGTVYSDQNYTVSDFRSLNSNTQYTDFLVFNYNSNRDGENYYTFDGWTVKDKDDTVYKIDQSIPGDELASLADGDGNIKFVGKWSKIEPMTDDQLQDASAKLTLNALVGVDSQPLITQSVNGEPATGNDVELKEDDTISYTVQAELGGYIIRSSQGEAMSTMQGFAHFIYQVKVDSNLEFTNLNDDGTVTLTFTAKNFKPTQTNIKGATISGGSGTWTITFDPKNVPVNGGNPYIEVTMDSIESRLSDNDEPIVLSGLNFKLKASAVNDDVTLSTSANVVGTMDLHDKAMQVRAYYQSVNAFLGYPDWKDYFDATADTPTAVAHASQFIDYELKEIDLATDNMGLKANTCTATFKKPTYGIRVFAYDKATEKEDGSATGLANAAFALYKAEDVALAPDGSVMINQGATALKSGTTGADGYMTLGDLDEGTYYLFETQAPAGYAKNAQPWKITLPTDADTQTNMADVKIAYTLIPQTTEPDDDKPGENQPSSTQGSGSVSDNTSGNASGSTQNTETTQTQTTDSTAAAAAAASAIPQTSDESNPVFWTVLLLASGMTLAGITLCRRKTARHRS